MRKAVCSFAVVLFIAGFLAVPSMAQEQQVTREEQEKNTLISNVMALRNQETKVAVLEQIYNEQMQALKQMQAVFCDQYKLDPDKLRRGFYSYDEQQGKFVEKTQAMDQTEEAMALEERE